MRVVRFHAPASFFLFPPVLVFWNSSCSHQPRGPCFLVSYLFDHSTWGLVILLWCPPLCISSYLWWSELHFFSFLPWWHGFFVFLVPRFFLPRCFFIFLHHPLIAWRHPPLIFIYHLLPSTFHFSVWVLLFFFFLFFPSRVLFSAFTLFPVIVFGFDHGLTPPSFFTLGLIVFCQSFPSPFFLWWCCSVVFFSFSRFFCIFFFCAAFHCHPFVVSAPNRVLFIPPWTLLRFFARADFVFFFEFWFGCDFYTRSRPRHTPILLLFFCPVWETFIVSFFVNLTFTLLTSLICIFFALCCPCQVTVVHKPFLVFVHCVPSFPVPFLSFL